jgi:para-nitrobenzyl esterase
MYQFDWQSPARGGTLGACHGIEIPFVFGTLLDVRLRFIVGALPGARRLSRRIRESWVAFARTGSPDCPALAGWPVWDDGERRSMRLGARCGAEPARFRDSYGFWESHI